MTSSVEAPTAHAVMLFDGVCNLCHETVNFVIDRDEHDYFRFASLQSDVGISTLATHGQKAITGDPDSIVLVEDDKFYSYSTAALRIARHLRGPWKWLYAFIIVPRPLRDLVYRFIARNRYRWFGRTEVCRVPTPELRAKFLA